MNKLKLLLICNFVNIFGFGLFSPLFAVFVLKLSNSPFLVSSSTSIYALVSGIAIILFGKIEDTRLNRTYMVVIGYITLALAGLSFLFITKPFEIYIVQIFNAIGVGILYPAWKSIYSNSEHHDRQSFEWGLFDGGNQIVAAIAALLGGLIISAFNFQALFIIMFFIQGIGAVVSLNLLYTPERND